MIVEENIIKSINYARRGMEAYQNEDHIIDGTGMYLLPGLINLHAHIHDRANCPQEYLYKLWLACGITTVRDVGSNINLTIDERKKFTVRS